MMAAVPANKPARVTVVLVYTYVVLFFGCVMTVGNASSSASGLPPAGTLNPMRFREAVGRGCADQSKYADCIGACLTSIKEKIRAKLPASQTAKYLDTGALIADVKSGDSAATVHTQTQCGGVQWVLQTLGTEYRKLPTVLLNPTTSKTDLTIQKWMFVSPDAGDTTLRDLGWETQFRPLTEPFLQQQAPAQLEKPIKSFLDDANPSGALVVVICAGYVEMENGKPKRIQGSSDPNKISAIPAATCHNALQHTYVITRVNAAVQVWQSYVGHYTLKMWLGSQNKFAKELTTSEFKDEYLPLLRELVSSVDGHNLIKPLATAKPTEAYAKLFLNDVTPLTKAQVTGIGQDWDKVDSKQKLIKEVLESTKTEGKGIGAVRLNFYTLQFNDGSTCASRITALNDELPH